MKKIDDDLEVFPEAPPCQAPWLVYPCHRNRDCNWNPKCDSNEKSQTFCTLTPYPPLHNQLYKQIPQLLDSRVIASFHGWAVLRHLTHDTHHEMFSLCNPTTSQTVHLPSLDEFCDRNQVFDPSACILTAPPDLNSSCDDQCVLLLFYDTGIGHDLVFYCWPTMENCKWIEQRVELCDGGYGIQVYEIFSPTILDNAIYAGAMIKEADKGCCPTLVCVEVSDIDDNSNSLFFRSILQDNHQYRTYLLESCGRLYSVVLCSAELCSIPVSEFRVWELDMERIKWVKVTDLDGRTFFVGKDCCTWCWGDDALGLQGDCVYTYDYHDEYCCNKVVGLFNLRDKSWTFFRPGSTTDQPPCGKPSWLVQPCLSGRSLDEQRNEARIKKLPLLKQGCQEELKLNYEAQQSVLFDLPLYMMELMMRKLPLVDYWNFRDTCKIFRSTFPPLPQWRTNDLLPLFIHYKQDGGLCEVMDPLRGDSRSAAIVDFPSDDFSIVFSKNGFLLIIGEDTGLHYLNPFTREHGICPPNESIFRLKSIGISTTPISSDCVTVGLCYDSSSMMMIHSHRTGDQVWREVSLKVDRGFHRMHVDPVYHLGAFYFLGYRGQLGVLEHAHENSSWSEYEDDRYKSYYKYTYHLVEHDGSLLSMATANDDGWYPKEKGEVVLHKFNRQTKNWVKVQNLGNWILFVGHNLTCSVVKTESKVKNRIYFPRIKRNSLIYYSLETGKYHCDNDEECRDDLCNSIIPSLYCWI